MVPMLAGSVAMALMFTNGRGGTLSYVTGGLFGVSMLGMVGVSFFGQAGRPNKRDSLTMRREYLRRLGQLRRQVRRTVRDQRRAMFYRHPDPDTLWWFAQSARLWERRPADSDFAVVRMALGPLRLATPLRPTPTAPVEDLELLSASALRAFVTTYAIVNELPVAVALRGFARIYTRGDGTRVRACLRSVIAQAATFHAPDDLLIAVCCDHTTLPEWEYLKWLPHALHPTKVDALGQVRLIGRSLRTIESHLEEVLANRPRFDANRLAGDGPHVLVIVDGGDPTGADQLMADIGPAGVTLVEVGGQPPRNLDESVLVLEIGDDGRLRTTTVDGSTEVGRADGITVAEGEAFARTLTPLRLSALSRTEQPLASVTELADLLEIRDPYQFDPTAFWQPRPHRNRLRVPIGVAPDGTPVELDLKESAQDGIGPHGLLVGATGSGKSELLRTLVLGLAASHSPEVLNFVLIDFKGGATFTRLDRLPHTSAVITNLAKEISLVDRMEAAIKGELVRRQELLRAAGNFASQRDYERARASNTALQPLPSLLIICDEFSELLTAKPEFIDMFVQIGRVGRSLGVHLLLASQRLEEGRLRGLDTHLSYRIGLRTFSPMESRAVLGVPDAFELPRSPGHGYLRSGTEPIIRFKAAYASGGLSPAGPVALSPATGDRILRALLYVPDYVEAAKREDSDPLVEQPTDDDVFGESLLDVMVGRMQGRGTPAHRVWLPPLDNSVGLGRVLGPLQVHELRGLVAARPELVGRLRPPVALVDRPFEQRRDVLVLSLGGAAGHVVVVGAPQSGKSTLVRTLMCALALTHTSTEVQFHALDFGGGGLLGLRGLPHTSAVYGRLDVDEVRRTVAEVHSLMRAREQRFATTGVDSMATYRSLRQQSRVTDDPFGDVFLIIDGWSTLRSEFEDLEGTVSDIATRGLSFGIHVVIAATRWMDLRPSIRDLLGTRLELRLGDPVDSEQGRRLAANVPTDQPGRGLTSDGLHFLSLLPRLDDDRSADPEPLVTAVREAWRWPGAPAVRMLPDRVPYDSLPQPDRQHSRWRFTIGMAESDLAPVGIDFAAEPHFLLFGDVESGKSSFLRMLAHSITTAYTPAEAAVIAIDYRRSLLGAVPAEHLVEYASDQGAAEEMVGQIAAGLAERLPGRDVTPDQLRSRSWWSGPELFLLVDDYDLVAGGSVNPLLPLLPFAAQARDIGLHVVLTRRSGGAGRGMYETFISRMREYGSPGLVMSGDREEGTLLGSAAPSRMPPGRGWLVTRREGKQLIQLAWLPPTS